MEMTLPDCTDIDIQLTLSPEEEEELLYEIAEKGRKGLEEFTSRYASSLAGSEMEERLRKYRERLDKQAGRMLDNRRAELENHAREKEKEMFRQMDVPTPAALWPARSSKVIPCDERMRS